MKFYKKPKVFIASTVEGIGYAESLLLLLEHENYDITPWPLHFKKGFDNTVNQLINASEFDFAIIIFTPDDITRVRETEYITPRDNLVFELGLFLGLLDKDRVFPIVPKEPKIKLPSDLIGINPFYFNYNSNNNTVEKRNGAIKEASIRIKDKINIIGVKNKIIFHDKMILRPLENKIGFKLAFTGPGSLVNVKFHAHLIKVKRSKVDKSYYNNWNDLKLTTTFAPEISISWGYSHVLEDSSTITEIIKPKKKNYCLEDFEDLDKLKIRLDINGYESNTMKPVYGKKIYTFNDLKCGEFLNFYIKDSIGTINTKSIDWDKFNGIIDIPCEDI